MTLRGLLEAFPPLSPAISGTLPVCVTDLLPLTYLFFCSNQEECGSHIILHLHGHLWVIDFRDVKQELKLSAKGQSKTNVYRLFVYYTCIIYTANDKKHIFCSVTRCPHPSRPPTQAVFLSQAHAGNNVNKASPFSVRDAVNIF